MTYQTSRERLAMCEVQLREAQAKVAQMEPEVEAYYRLILPGMDHERRSEQTEWVLDRVAEELSLTPEQRAELSRKINPPIAFAG